MSKAKEHTRRAFLLRLAKATAFVPPAMATLDVRPVAAGGGGMSTTTGGMGGGMGAATTGSASSTAQIDTGLRFQFGDPQGASSPGPQAPWAKPPPGGD